MERSKYENKKIILLGLITWYTFNDKALRTNHFEGGYYGMIMRGSSMGLNEHVIINIYVIVVDIVIKGPHVNCVNM